MTLVITVGMERKWNVEQEVRVTPAREGTFLLTKPPYDAWKCWA